MQIFLVFLIGTVLFYSFQYFPFSSAIAGITVGVFSAFKKKPLLVFILLAGTVYAFLRYEPVQKPDYSPSVVTVSGTFSDYPSKTAGGNFRQLFRATAADYRETGERLDALRSKDIIVISDQEFHPGTEYQLGIKMLGSREAMNPGQTIWYYPCAKLITIYRTGSENKTLAVTIEEYRHRINEYIDSHFHEHSGELLASVTTGRTYPMDEKLRNAFNATGLAHILSISGTHFGLLSIILFSVFRLIIELLPYKILLRTTLFLTPSQAAAILCVPFMVFYLGLSGASIPAIRSFIMIGLFLVGLVIGRKGFWLNSVLFAAFLILLWDPASILSLSFQLSFLAVLFIGFTIRHREDQKQNNALVRHAKSALLMTFAASVGTAPLVAYHFHYFSLISPVTNLVIAPVIGFILVPLAVLSAFLYLLSGHFVFTTVLSVVADASISFINYFAGLPLADIKIPAFPTILVILFYAGFVFYFLFNKRLYLLLIPFLPLLIYLLLHVFSKETLSVTCLDVGQGDAALIELPDGRTMVLDTGLTGREITSYLKYRGKRSVDFLILSHVHPDHTGGLHSIIDGFDVKEIWDNGRMVLPETAKETRRRSFKRGDVIEGNGYTISVLHPYPAFYTAKGKAYDAENNDSLVLRIESRNKSFLFTGDIEEEAEENISHLGKWLKSDVIKVPHHGSRSSAYEPFFRSVSSSIAVVSVGKDNTFGHPHQETLRLIQGISVCRTDTDGAVHMKVSGNAIDVQTCREFLMKKACSLRDEAENYKRLFLSW